ncbi:hypothetical protein ASU31_10255 [Pedobacter ginsenosidimutans]|uniref:Uncharacterized protein n=1 Tax=Pedobacter ginsenosidimutans TaxID=687842 RepID=A0A0T5VRT3_9SPHI|nr:hypothetical protein [Pedobacter ginsenosidimutans]KRT16534.1 hypothetical protein ASU31_10255 [Pedobacter ginsenosidimutans]
MDQIENHLQRAWSDGVYNINIEDVKIAIEELKEMDDEHGAIWVSVIKNDENVIEVDKDLTLTIIFEEREPINAKLNSWQEVIDLYQLLLNQKFDDIINLLK